MLDRGSWGLFQGFNAPPEEARWREPCCVRCDGTASAIAPLQPWVDWWSIGTIGYCALCTRFCYVRSTWEEVPNTHPKEEREQLVAHHVSEIDFDELRMDEMPGLWEWHETLPQEQSVLDRLTALRLRCQGNSNEQSIILTHMIWSLIWNVNVPAGHLLASFFEFSGAHPQYVSFKGKPVWLGHQVDLAEALERRYPDEVPRALFAYWESHRASAESFKEGLGFFIPRSSVSLRKYGAEFVHAAEQARFRFAI